MRRHTNLGSNINWKAILIPAIATFLLACKPPEPFEPGHNRYRFHPLANRTSNPLVISGLMLVVDIDAMRFLSTRPFPVQVGSTATGVAESRANGAILLVKMAIAPDGQSVNWSAEIRKGDRLIVSQSGSVPVTDPPKPKQ
jgi:hypothetical protein